jgi:hypothetical protein
MNVQTLAPPTVDLTAIKERQHAAWGSGDYAMIGTTLLIVGERLCEAVDFRKTNASSMSPPATAMRLSPRPGASPTSCRRTMWPRCSSAGASVPKPIA